MYPLSRLQPMLPPPVLLSHHNLCKNGQALNLCTVIYCKCKLYKSWMNVKQEKPYSVQSNST
jgi:hypothetical protein